MVGRNQQFVKNVLKGGGRLIDKGSSKQEVRIDYL
jgi:hypothetical protein